MCGRVPGSNTTMDGASKHLIIGTGWFTKLDAQHWKQKKSNGDTEKKGNAPFWRRRFSANVWRHGFFAAVFGANVLMHISFLRWDILTPGQFYTDILARTFWWWVVMAPRRCVAEKFCRWNISMVLHFLIKIIMNLFPYIYIYIYIYI